MQTLHSLCLVKSCKALPCKEKNFLTTYNYQYCVSLPLFPYISLNEHVIGGDTPCCFMIEGGEFRQVRLQYYRITKSLSGKKRYNLLSAILIRANDCRFNYLHTCVVI